MALMEVNFFFKSTDASGNDECILPADKVFFGEETEEENKPFKDFVSASRSNGKLHRLGNRNMY